MENKEIEKISKKLNILISLNLRSLISDKDFTKRSKRGTGDLANYLADFGLDAKDIAEILDAPVRSIRTMLTPKRRKK